MFALPSHNAYYAMTLPCSENCIYFIQDCNLGTVSTSVNGKAEMYFPTNSRKEQPISTPVWSWTCKVQMGENLYELSNSFTILQKSIL